MIIGNLRSDSNLFRKVSRIMNIKLKKNNQDI